jgi:hypothetical protein
MKKPRINKSPRPLLAVVALVVAFSVVSAPMAQALYYNLIRDAYTLWNGVPYSNLNTEANVNACGGVVSAKTSSYPWMVGPLTTLTQTDASYGYIDAFDANAYAFTRYFLYFAYSNPASFNTYLDSIASYRQAYSDLADTYYEAYSDQSQAASDEFFNAWRNNGFPQGAQDARDAIYYTLYSSSWLAIDQYYVLEAGNYGYNAWASNGAPYYGLFVICGAYGEYAGRTSNNLVNATYNNPSAYTVGGVIDYDAMSAAADEIRAYYDEVEEYWGAWSEYYRLTSDYYEG